MSNEKRDEILKAELIDHLNNGCLDGRCELVGGENFQADDSFFDHLVEVINDVYSDEE